MKTTREPKKSTRIKTFGHGGEESLKKDSVVD
jgi:hypothetical protein